jgi:lipoprotein-anchoring transpeptidase ErfK/SrfK
MTDRTTTHRRSALAAALLATAALAAACTSGGAGGGEVTKTVTARPSSDQVVSTPPSSAPPSTPPATSTSPAEPATVVHVRSLESDGETFGIGMPIVLYFSPPPTDSTAFTKAVTVTVNGKPADGAWFWEQPTADEVNANIVEAHYRLSHWWPANSKIHVSFPIRGLSAGKGLVYSGKLTSLDFRIGAAHISKINARTLRMRVISNGRHVRTIQVSLGAAATPTYNGVKVVMQKGEIAPGSDKLRPDGAVRMRGPGYDEIVDWSVRVTESGEYIHAAPWNSQIGRLSTSNGCTNLSVSDAKWFYHFARIGDVAIYSNTDGKQMPSWDGLGDWNVPWSQWVRGGLLLNH